MMIIFALLLPFLAFGQLTISTLPATFTLASGTQTLSPNFSLTGVTTSATCSLQSYIGEFKMPAYTSSGVAGTNSITYDITSFFQIISISGTQVQLNNAFAGLLYQAKTYFTNGAAATGTKTGNDYIEMVCTEASATSSVSVMVSTGTALKDDSTCGGSSCHNKGWCDATTNTCQCWLPYHGNGNAKSCQYKFCGNCKNSGTCDATSTTGVCTCGTGFSGDDCSIVACQVTNCNGRGRCNPINGVCECYAGYTGRDCDLAYCLNNCNYNGVCDFAVDATTKVGTCTCFDNYFGKDCAYKRCPRDCGAWGGCNHQTGECNCYGIYGANNQKDCMFSSCPSDCTNPAQGTCNYYSGECECNTGYAGVSCELS